jgi:1,4-dihydroxy-2-naphthoyl-CoA synthase
MPASSYAHLLVETTAEGVCTITLDRPDRLNAVNGVLADELPRAVHAAARDDAARVVVITGPGAASARGSTWASRRRCPPGRAPSGSTISRGWGDGCWRSSAARSR